MDPYTQAGMIFAVVMTIIIGGFIVTFPIMRRLGSLMEESVRERRAARLGQGQVDQIEGSIADLHNALERMEGHMSLLAERQDFVENLLGHREPERLPDGETWNP